MEQKGISYVLENYYLMLSKFDFVYKPDKDALIYFGYFLLGKGKSKEVLDAMKLQIQNYPDFWNSYDSIGDIYINLGQNDLAIENIKKSIKLNPDNTFGLEKLQKLKGINDI